MCVVCALVLDPGVRLIVRANRLLKGRLLRIWFLERKKGKSEFSKASSVQKLWRVRGEGHRWMGSAWRGWPLERRSDLRVQGIQDVQLGDDGSRMAVIDPSYQDAGTKWEGMIVLSQGRWRQAYSLCRSGYVPHSRRFLLHPRQALIHWLFGTGRWTATSRARWIRHRYRWPGGREEDEIRRSTMS